MNLQRNVDGENHSNDAYGEIDSGKTPGIIYWHRELPPFDAEPIAEHTVEATSTRVRGTISHPDEWWDPCYHSLMAEVRARLAQEVARLGGNYAHVLDESIDPRHDHATGETWLHGLFTYVLYRQSAKAAIGSQALRQ